MSKVGITSIGAHIPYFYLERDVIANAWGGINLKGVRSMANVDEDSVTMAVEAVRNCFRFIDKQQITNLYFASVSAPYAEKSHAGIVATACGLPRKLFTADFMSSTKSGTSAMKSAMDAVKADYKSLAIVTAADCRNAYPKTLKEQILGDAAAAVAIGSENVIANIDYFTTVSDEIVDVWRNAGEQFVNWGEDRFIIENGYMNSLSHVINEILDTASMQPSDFSKIILPAPGMREYLRLAKKLGFDQEQVQNPLLMEVGDCGTAHTMLLLAAALENARPGDSLLLANYGNGADAMILTVTEEVKKIQNNLLVQNLLSNRRSFPDYNRFLSFRSICPTVPSRYNLKPSNAKTWREQDTFLRFNGGKCTKCGAEIFPMNRVCYKCGAIDEFEKTELSDRISKVFTFTLDMLAGSSDDPVVGQICADDEFGVRYYTVITDFNPQDIKIGMPLEFTFRKMHALGNFNNYYWKFKPQRSLGVEPE